MTLAPECYRTNLFIALYLGYIIGMASALCVNRCAGVVILGVVGWVIFALWGLLKI